MILRWLRFLFAAKTGQVQSSTDAEEGIARLPIDRVRPVALRQLRNPSQFEIAVPPRHILPPPIPTDLRDIFAIGSLIKSTHGDLWFDVQYLAESHAYPCLKVGTDVDHTEVWVDVTSGEAMWMEEIEGTIEGAWMTMKNYRSIWHYILVHCAEVYGYDWRSMT